jgi:4-hydroxy-tetrahydrodipicolinate synthase
MSDSSIKGVWTAIGTPFTESGAIDWASFEGHLAQQAAGKVSGIVISGTTGESPTLTVQEKISMVRKARAILPAGIRVMAGSGGNNTAQSIELSKLCVDAGADSLLIVTPPYNKPSMAGLKLHYQMISDSVSVPLCLYHVPGRTGQSLSAPSIAALTTIPKVVAVKEASGDLALYGRLVSASKANILTGDDPTYLPSLVVGGMGVISVVSNIFPEAMVEMTRAFAASQNKRALEIHKVLLPAIDVLFCEGNPGPLKAAFEIFGLAKNILRAPLAPVTSENYALIKSTLQTAKSALSIILERGE